MLVAWLGRGSSGSGMVFGVSRRGRGRRILGQLTRPTDHGTHHERRQPEHEHEHGEGIAGAHHVSKRCRNRRRNGIDTMKPSRPKATAPLAPATSPAPASRPTWCSTCGASPTTVPMAPTTACQTPRNRLPRSAGPLPNSRPRATTAAFRAAAICSDRSRIAMQVLEAKVTQARWDGPTAGMRRSAPAGRSATTTTLARARGLSV